VILDAGETVEYIIFKHDDAARRQTFGPDLAQPSDLPVAVRFDVAQDLPVSARKHERDERIAMIVQGIRITSHHMLRMLKFIYHHSEPAGSHVDGPYVVS
jgi:hypothetical protein